MRAAVYLRVSTDHQTVENQRREVERLARARGFEPVFFEETESAAKRRPILDGLMAGVHRGEFRGVVVWALDRLHRSMAGAVQTVLELDRLGVSVLSVREPWLDTSGPVRSLLVAIFGWVAEQERARLIERTQAGLQRAREAGRVLGRPPRPDRERKLVAAMALLASGSGLRATAREVGLPASTLRLWCAQNASQASAQK